MKLAKKNESGQIFVLVLILLAIGPLLILPMLQLSYSAQKFHQIVEINTMNAYAADSGVEYARYRIYSDPYEIQTVGLNENLLIEDIDVHVTAEFDYDSAAYRIISTASKAKRSATIECVIVIDVGLFGKVVACDGDLNITSCEFESTETGSADVYVRGDVTLSGSQSMPTYINGDIAASGSISIGNFVTITGVRRTGATVMKFPPVDSQIHEFKATEGGVHPGNLSLVEGNHSLGPLYIDGNLSIIGKESAVARVTLGGTVYVNGSVTISRAELYGFGDIVARDNIDITKTTFGLTIVKFLPLLLSVDGSIKIDGSESYYPFVQSIIYAPGNTITLNWVNAYGSVAAGVINLFRSTIDYPAELRGRADLPGAGLDTVTYQFK